MFFVIGRFLQFVIQSNWASGLLTVICLSAAHDEALKLKSVDFQSGSGLSQRSTPLGWR